MSWTLSWRSFETQRKIMLGTGLVWLSQNSPGEDYCSLLGLVMLYRLLFGPSRYVERNTRLLS
jgi:hypothetical protein